MDAPISSRTAPTWHANPIIASLQLLVWLLAYPSAWRSHLGLIDPALSPGFTLADLTQVQWSNPAVKKLLLIGYGLLHLMINVPLGVGMWYFGLASAPLMESIMLSMGFSLATGIMLGTMLGVAGSIPGGLVTGVAFALVFNLIDGTTTTDLLSLLDRESFKIVLSVSFSMGLGVAISVTRVGRLKSLRRQIGGWLVGILLGGAIILIYEVILIPEDIGVVALVCVLFITALRLRRGSWRCTARLWMWLVIVFIGAIGMGHGAKTETFSFPDFPPFIFSGGNILDDIIEGVKSIIFETIAEMMVPQLVVLGRLDWLALGVWIGLINGAIYSALYVVIAIWLGPILLYPFVTLWNLLLYLGDVGRARERSSLFRLHSVFWDEYQRLPLLGLAAHLVIEAKSDPVAGQAAMESLAAGPQGWAVRKALRKLKAQQQDQQDYVTDLS